MKEKLAVAIVFGLLAGYSETVPLYAADDVQTVKASKTAVKDDFFQQGEGFSLKALYSGENMTRK